MIKEYVIYVCIYTHIYRERESHNLKVNSVRKEEMKLSAVLKDVNNIKEILK